jgi:hypothetical protein
MTTTSACLKAPEDTGMPCGVQLQTPSSIQTTPQGQLAGLGAPGSQAANVAQLAQFGSVQRQLWPPTDTRVPVVYARQFPLE